MVLDINISMIVLTVLLRILLINAITASAISTCGYPGIVSAMGVSSYEGCQKRILSSISLYKVSCINTENC